MKKLALAVMGLLCATAIAVQAQDATNAPAKHAKKELTAEQQAVVKEMLAKYDTNKDGKLEKNERAAMTQEDKDKLAKAEGSHKKNAKKNADDSTKADNGN